MKRTTNATKLLLGLLLLVPATGPQWSRQGADTALSPYFSITGGDPSVDAFPLKSTRVKATVNGVIADVLVTQVYANEGSRAINGRYVFPGSTRAAVHGMVIRVGDQQVVATIREREQARQEFHEAKASGKSATLLEQKRPNVFSMSVANIMPGDRVEVELHYTELLLPTDGNYQFVYPAVVAPRYGDGATERAAGVVGTRESALPSLGIDVTLATGIPLQDLHSRTHEVVTDWKDSAEARVTLANEADAGDRDFILDYRLAGSQIQSGLMLYRGQDENFFLVMLEPPERVPADDITPREYIFILDVSGSMDGFPLQTGKTLIADLIGSLRTSDRFNVVLFAGGSQVLSAFSVPATRDNVQNAIRMIDAQRGGGATELAGALREALALPRDERFSRSVVVITDGLVSAEPDVFALIRKNLDRSNLFAFGIGSSVNRHLIEGMARAGAGEPFVVTGPADAPEAAKRFHRYIESPVLTHVGVAFDGFDVHDVEPEALPDLFAERPVILFGKWRGSATGRIELSGMTARGPYSRTIDVSASARASGNPALRSLWARARVARLSDESDSLGAERAKAAITQLGLSYSLLTRYTSFIAVLEQVRNDAADAMDVDQPIPLARGLSCATGLSSYAMGAEPGLFTLAAGLLLLILVTGLMSAAARRRSW